MWYHTLYAKKMAGKKKKIAIVGLGYVGLPLALLCEEKGHDVFGIVKSKESAEKLNNKESFITDYYVQKKIRKTKIKSEVSFSKIKEAEIIVVCVPTPVTKNYLPDFKPLISAIKQIGKNLQKNQLVILESTVNPGVSEDLVIPILEKESGISCGKDFYYAYCPERINPGDNKWTVENIPRVIGGFDKKSTQLAYAFYTSILGIDIKKMGSLKEAEAVKIVENSFRDVNIAFANELAKSFSLLGIDLVNVLDGAETKPFSFLRHDPGCGVGGHCIPVDPYYLIRSMRKKGFSHKFLSTAREINNSMPSYTVGLLEEGLKELGRKLENTKIGLLGVSYKSDIKDTRESPFFHIEKELKKRKAKVLVYDPHVLEISTHKTLKAILEESEALIIVTAHSEFLTINPKSLSKYEVKVIVDGRNCLDKNEFVKSKILYKGIGR